jgi:predicted HTH domain antitoxin
MAITIELPPDLEQRLKAETPDLAADFKRALAIELYREQRITIGQFAAILGISRWDADGVLKEAKVYYDQTIEDVIAESEGLRELRERRQAQEHDAGRR